VNLDLTGVVIASVAPECDLPAAGFAGAMVLWVIAGAPTLRITFCE
jgi:hypothetical protein